MGQMMSAEGFATAAAAVAKNKKLRYARASPCGQAPRPSRRHSPAFGAGTLLPALTAATPPAAAAARPAKTW